MEEQKGLLNTKNSCLVLKEFINQGTESRDFCVSAVRTKYLCKYCTDLIKIKTSALLRYRGNT